LFWIKVEHFSCVGEVETVVTALVIEDVAFKRISLNLLEHVHLCLLRIANLLPNIQLKQKILTFSPIPLVELVTSDVDPLIQILGRSKEKALVESFSVLPEVLRNLVVCLRSLGIFRHAEAHAGDPVGLFYYLDI
jgi:hypothetical protein